jgi:hypothetical protein
MVASEMDLFVKEKEVQTLSCDGVKCGRAPSCWTVQTVQLKVLGMLKNFNENLVLNINLYPVQVLEFHSTVARILIAWKLKPQNNEYFRHVYSHS